jgi:hypothetical protein
MSISVIRPQIWHVSFLGPNPVLQPQEPLRLGCNVGFFHRPYFQGGDHRDDLLATCHIPLQPGICLEQHQEAMTQWVIMSIAS